ncbi:CbiX/SirB N-terminal domain-containing protein [Streptomyces albidoflavus]|uniref:sirohydrochlorin chelatase n=1 Tax=Streptomyces albidoflavus TaxID=1886 RepID=UPI001164C65E|nr:CbiX/SirB N-terminal domain-containing protein [Streptomyces albidoflavus]QDD61972.1 sirohydrochlorin chelatase [Streptomyces albidoflavus]
MTPTDHAPAAPTLLALAHGTRDQEGIRVVRELTARVRGLRPGTRVELAWLGLVEPTVSQALARLPGPVVAVPLLLARGYHVRTDIPALLTGPDAARVRMAPALGPSPRLAEAAAAQLARAGRPPGPTPVVLAAAGSTDPRARADTHHSAHLLATHLNAPVTPAFLGGTGPDPADAVTTWHSHGHTDVAVAAHLLAPGFFLDRLQGTGARWVGGALGRREPVAELVWERYDAGCGGGVPPGRRTSVSTSVSTSSSTTASTGPTASPLRQPPAS